MPTPSAICLNLCSSLIIACGSVPVHQFLVCSWPSLCTLATRALPCWCKFACFYACVGSLDVRRWLVRSGIQFYSALALSLEMCWRVACRLSLRPAAWSWSTTVRGMWRLVRSPLFAICFAICIYDDLLEIYLSTLPFPLWSCLCVLRPTSVAW